MEERREELAEQFAELQKRLKAQALEHNIIRHELQQARSELEAIIVNSKSPAKCCLLVSWQQYLIDFSARQRFLSADAENIG